MTSEFKLIEQYHAEKFVCPVIAYRYYIINK